MSSSCACGSGRDYAGCCQPFHAGAEPPDAESLMRSRFSAFVRGEHAYLFRTLHADHDDHARGDKALIATLVANGKRTHYEALRILGSDGPDADGIARVLFHVTMRSGGKEASFAELSSFAHDGVGWRYVGGVTRACRSGQARELTIASFA